MDAPLHKDEGTTQEQRQQQAREFRIPEFNPPWSHQPHPSIDEAAKAAHDWALYHFHTLVGSERFQKIMHANIDTILGGGYYSTGPVWGLEFGIEFLLLLFVLDDEVLERAIKSSLSQGAGSVARIFLELLLVMLSSFPHDKVLQESLEKYLSIDHNCEQKRDRIDKFLAQAMRHPGAAVYNDEMESFPTTFAFQNLWKRATSVMPEEWSVRFAHVMQRDMFAMFQEAHERNLGLIPSIPDYILRRRAYGFAESSLVVGEYTEGIHVTDSMYYSQLMQHLVQGTNDAVNWHNDIQSFCKELIDGEVNLVHLISKEEKCSYNRAAEIVNGMLVDRCKDIEIAAAKLRQLYSNELSLEIDNIERYIGLCTNFISASHAFHQQSSRFRLSN